MAIREPRYGAMSRDFQSFAGSGDRDLPMSEVQGYQPVSRIGEIVMNSFGAHAHPSPRMSMPTHHITAYQRCRLRT